MRRAAAVKVYPRRPELVPDLLADEDLSGFERCEVAETARLDRTTVLWLARHDSA